MTAQCPFLLNLTVGLRVVHLRCVLLAGHSGRHLFPEVPE